KEDSKLLRMQLYRRVALPTEPFAADKTAQVDRFFTDRARRGYFNGVVLISDGEHIYTKAYGYANYRTREKLTVSSTFQLASISKTITATAVLMLAQDGKVDVNAPVSRYLEGFERPKVTVAMLLSHKSGLADYTRFTAGVWRDFNKKMTNEDMLAIMIKRRPKPYAAPGVMYKYCNTNYALLASIVEHVTGTPFSQWVHENIFTPVGMTSTFFCTEENMELCEHKTMGYTSRKMPYGLNYLDGVLGDKGVYSTVEDLMKFDMALTGGFLLTEQWIEKAYTNHTNDADPYGYGWRLCDYNGREIVYHNGWWHGYKGRFMRIPKENKLVVILENTARGSFSIPTLMSIGEKLFDKYNPEATIDETGDEKGDTAEGGE
ncbi:MAG: serine hydrolase, partial [Flavobacteriales bacterium]|nr:serine hydrolase [Flavobacteriales bacterium]